MRRTKADEKKYAFRPTEPLRHDASTEQATEFVLGFCAHGDCGGLHLLPMRQVTGKNGKKAREPICEVVLTGAQARALAKFCYEHAIDQAKVVDMEALH